MSLDLRSIARATGGVISGRQVLCPGPGHSRIDRSLSIRLSHQSPTGWIVHSYVGDRFDVCRDFVAEKLGLAPDAWRSRRQSAPQTRPEINLYNVHIDNPDDAGRIARAIQIWTEAGPAQGTVVERYLASRGLALPDGDEVLRYHNATPWRDEANDRTIYVPCMIAAMRAINGDAITAIHRTRLTPEGIKVDRRMLGIAAGAAVKLDGDDAVTMGLAIGEGVESCLAARALGFAPVWAMASAGAVASFPVLGGVEALNLLAENDPASDRAINQCAERWHAVGREVTVVTPNFGSDLNDALRGAA